MIKAVEQSLTKENRYQNYLKIQKEAAYYDMTYVEKRQKDKKFGKMFKNYKDSLRKR